jgi:hypothetical protein
MKSIQEMAQEALWVQDACNLSGVVHTFSQTMTLLRKILEQEPGFSTDKLNKHPIAVLYASKIASLTSSDSNFSIAFEECQKLAEKV